MDAITVTCDNSVEPGQITIAIAGVGTFPVSFAVYQALKGPLGLPDNPCDIL